MAASTDAAHRPQFYGDFLKSEILVIQHGVPAAAPQRITIAAGEKLALMTWEKEGRRLIPIFSSLERLQSFAKKPETYLAMNAEALLRITAGADLLLNPGSTYGKEFTAGEIARLLDGSIGRPTETWVANKPTQVLLAQPAKYPHALANALRRYFEQTPEVTRAYLAYFHNSGQDAKPHTLIAIEMTGDWDRVVSGAGIVAAGIEIPDPPIDVMRLVETEDFGGYFGKSVGPFYEKTPPRPI